MGTHSEDSLDTTTMYKLVGYQEQMLCYGINHYVSTSTKSVMILLLYLIASVLAVATSLPIEDTPEVVAAKEEFNAAFAAAEAGEHINLRPVNDDAQAAQIAASYLADSEDVAAAKAAFQAAFDDAAAGGLSAKQAPAPAALPFAGYPYGVNALNVLGAYPGYAAGLPYATNIATYPYAGLPVIAAPAAKA